MKKILLLSITSLAMLMADFTLEGDTLTPVSGTITTITDPTPTNPVSTNGIIPNSVDQIWADMNEPNTGWVSNMPSGFGQFKGPTLRTITALPSFDYANLWIEVEAAGDGSGCSIDINKAVNTRVEIGTIRMYTMRNNVWTLMSDTKNVKLENSGAGAPHPHPNVAMSRGCGLDEYDVNQNFEHYTLITSEYGFRTNANGYIEWRPQYYYRWHAWDKGGNVTPLDTLQAIFGTVYLRLVVDDPNKPDDRNLANYVGHVSSDARSNNGTTYIGDLGISRYKKITNDWQPFNFYVYKNKPSKTEIAQNPPPMVLQP